MRKSIKGKPKSKFKLETDPEEIEHMKDYTTPNSIYFDATNQSTSNVHSKSTKFFNSKTMK